MYQAEEKRYERMQYRRSGKSGLKLPLVALGLWENFGGLKSFEAVRNMIRKAFDLGITHFDLANNSGPPAGSAEENFGRILRRDLLPYRDELIISTKAGYYMWPGPYGDYGSRKYLMASIDQSLKRLGLEYVDVFYHHRPDPQTPLEETMGALDSIVRQGKALYVGLSNYYEGKLLKEALQILKELKTPCLIHQARYSMFDRRIEEEVLDITYENGVGTICFSPLEQGLLTDKYLRGIPEDSRAAGGSPFLNEENITEDKLNKVSQLNEVAKERGQKLAQMALAWILKDERITSVVMGASKERQILENVAAIKNVKFSEEEIQQIEAILNH